MIMAAPDQALRTNSIKRTFGKQNVSAKCRMCAELMRQLAILYWNARNFLKSNMLEARQGGAWGFTGTKRIKGLSPFILSC